MKINLDLYMIDDPEEILDFPFFEGIHIFDKENIRYGCGIKHNINHHSTKCRLYIKKKRKTKEKRINEILSYNFLGKSLEELNYLY